MSLARALCQCMWLITRGCAMCLCGWVLSFSEALGESVKALADGDTAAAPAADSSGAGATSGQKDEYESFLASF